MVYCKIDQTQRKVVVRYVVIHCSLNILRHHSVVILFCFVLFLLKTRLSDHLGCLLTGFKSRSETTLKNCSSVHLKNFRFIFKVSHLWGFIFKSSLIRVAFF